MNNKIKKNAPPFTQVPNSLLNCKILSLKAKGIFCFMYSKPNDWNFTASSMAKQLREGRDAILGAIMELKSLGWITYEKHTDGSGTYTLLFEPKTDNTDKKKPKSEKPTQDNTTVGKSDPFSNTDLHTNKDLYKGENEFLKDWNSIRSSILKKPSNINRLSLFEKSKFNSLKSQIPKSEFRKGMKGLFKQQNISFDCMTLGPDHFLEKIENYIRAYNEKIDTLYGKKDKTKNTYSTI